MKKKKSFSEVNALSLIIYVRDEGKRKGKFCSKIGTKDEKKNGGKAMKRYVYEGKS
jgi:hypothetical protein